MAVDDAGAGVLVVVVVAVVKVVRVAGVVTDGVTVVEAVDDTENVPVLVWVVL